MNKRVRIATTATYPEGMASAYRIHCYAKGLKENNVKVDVVSAKSLSKRPGKGFLFKGTNEGIPYTIVLNTDDSGKLMKYLWMEMKHYALMAHCLFTIRKYDVLWLYGMGLFPRLILLPVLRLAGKKVVLELNEYPYSTEGNKLTQIPFVRKSLQWLTLKLVFPLMDGVIAISENLKSLVKANAPKVPVLKVPVLVDVNRSDLDSVGERTSPHSNPYMFHAGSLSEQKDGIIKAIEAFALAAKELKTKGIKLDLVLTNKKTLPALWARIEAILQEHDLLQHLVITGYLNDSQLHHYLQHAAVLLINKPPSFQNKYNFPTKLGDYLLSGRPVIAASEGTELNQFLQDGKDSRVVPPNDAQAMATAIIDFCLDTEKARYIGEAGREAALLSFDYRRNAQRITDFLNSL